MLGAFAERRRRASRDPKGEAANQPYGHFEKQQLTREAERPAERFSCEAQANFTDCMRPVFEPTSHKLRVLRVEFPWVGCIWGGYHPLNCLTLPV